jgi:hypothetical protein
MAAKKNIGLKVHKHWEHWRMNPRDYQAICKLFDANDEKPDDYSDFVEMAERWPKGEIKQIFREHGLDPEIDWRAVATAFHKSFEEGDRGRPPGSSKSAISIEAVVRHPPKALGLSPSTYKRILVEGAATKNQIEKIIESAARVTLEELGLPRDFLSEINRIRKT